MRARAFHCDQHTYMHLTNPTPQPHPNTNNTHVTARGLYWEMWNLQLAEQELEGHLHTEEGEDASLAAHLQQQRGLQQQGPADLPTSSSGSSSEDEGGPSRPADAAAGLHRR